MKVDCAYLDDRRLEYAGVTFFHRPRALSVSNGITTTGIGSVLPDSIYAHELTHALGVGGHALALDCGNDSYGTDCDIVPYGDPFDIQGDRVFSTHSGAWHKQLMGWIDEDMVPTITESGNYIIHPIEEPRGNVYGLVIPLATSLFLDSGVEYDRVMVDYRTPVGFDYRINNIIDYPYIWDLDEDLDLDGVFLKFGYANGSHSTVLLDAHPNDPYDEDGYSPHGTPGAVGRSAHAMLNIGETFILPNNTGTVTPVGHVDVHMPGSLGYPNNTLQAIEVEVVIN